MNGLVLRRSCVFLRRAFLLCWLLLGLVLAPTLGLVHGVLHGGVDHTAIPHSHATSGMEDNKQSASQGGEGVVERLLPAHDAADCRLYDQQAHGDMVPGVVLLVLPHMPIGFVLRHQAGQAMGRFVALFDARGPPSCV